MIQNQNLNMVRNFELPTLTQSFVKFARLGFDLEWKTAFSVVHKVKKVFVSKKS